MNAVVTAIIAFLGQILPMVQSSASVAKVIGLLIELLPAAVKTAQDLVTPIKNIIAALQVNEATTEEQMAQLKQLDAEVDAAFEKEAARVEAEDRDAQ